MKLRKYVSVLAIAVLAVSCSKQGPAGPQGPAGANGSANVTISNYVIYTNQWLPDNSNTGWYVNLTTTIDPTYGAVSVLFSYDNANWFGLPYVGNTVGDVDINYVVSTNPNNVQIQYVPQTNGGSIGAPNTVYVQVSLVPPGVEAKHPGTNWNNAMEVNQLPEVQAAIEKLKK